MSTYIFRIFMCLFVVFILSLIGITSIFKALEKNGKNVEKLKKLTINIVSSSFFALILGLSSYTLTRNNIDLLKVSCIYIIIAGIFYGIYILYKKQYKRIVKFVVIPLTLLICIYLLKTLSYLLIETAFLLPLIISISFLSLINWLRYEVWEENLRKQKAFNILYLIGIIFFAIFSWNYLGKDIALITPMCELKVVDYLGSKGYDSKEYYTFPGNDLERGTHEFVQVHFKNDPCTYVYEYFYDENVVRQVKIFKGQAVEPIHKDGEVEVIE